MFPPHPDPGDDQLAYAEAGVAIMEFRHQGGLRYGHIVQRAECSDDRPAQDQRRDIQTPGDQGQDQDLLAGESREVDQLEERSGKRHRQPERSEGSCKRHRRDRAEPMGQVQAHEGYGRGGDHRHQERIVSVEYRRRHEGQQDAQRASHADPGEYAPPPAQSDHEDGEQTTQPGERGPPIRVGVE